MGLNHSSRVEVWLGAESNRRYVDFQSLLVCKCRARQCKATPSAAALCFWLLYRMASEYAKLQARRSSRAGWIGASMAFGFLILFAIGESRAKSGRPFGTTVLAARRLFGGNNDWDNRVDWPRFNKLVRLFAGDRARCRQNTIAQ